MAKRHRDWAVRARRRLIQDLGGRCVLCGQDWNLELDHINGTEVVLRDKESSARVCLYRREAKEGKLQVLCKPCNKAKGGRQWA